MGQLVFQATLGGQVNLVGPNTASTFNLNVPAVSSTLATLAAQTFAGTQTLSSGNLVFSGTSQFVSGDFSNATLLSRLAFQTSTTNSTTGIYALPNGTSTAASWQATNAADPTNASKVLIATNGSTDVQLVSGRNGTGTYLPLTFYTNGSEQMRLDTSGNVGVGVTPSAWGGTKAIEVGSKGTALFNYSATDSYFTQNAYFSSGWTYGSTAAASTYRQSGGAHYWNTAASGTAGNAITFTQAMTLDASSNLLVGTTGAIIAEKVAVVDSGGNNAITAKQAGGAGWCMKAWNNATTGNNAFIEFLTETSFTSRGSITYNRAGGLTAYNTTSDYRSKTVNGSVQNALSKLASLKPCTGRMNGAETDIDFFVAHELQEVVPSAVTGEKDAVKEDGTPDYQMVDKSALIPLLTAALQEQQALIQSLTDRLTALEGAAK